MNLFIRIVNMTFCIGIFALNVNAAESLDPEMAKPILIPIPIGLSIVDQLSQSDSEKNNTSERVEYKSVISDQTLNSIMQNLKTGDASQEIDPIEFRLRDAPQEKNKLNGTFTIYGRAAAFQNRGDITTKIRLRIRTYLVLSPDYSEIERAKTTKKVAFLEIKIKNPTFREKDGSHKYRIKLSDQSILKLFRANPNEPHFSKVLDEIRKDALQLKNEPRKIEAILKVVELLSHYGEDFIKPQYITTYIRESYEFEEKDYPIPTLTKKKKLKTKPTSIEYQLTIDRNVIGFMPSILPTDQEINVQRYFDPDYSGLRHEYPAHTRVVELKLPLLVNSLRPPYRSKLHRYIQRELVDSMERNILNDFNFNKGKSGHISKKLTEK
jgi:hypothetical protein